MSNDIPDKLSLACSIADRNRRHPFGNESSLSEGNATSTVDEVAVNPASVQPVEVAVAGCWLGRSRSSKPSAQFQSPQWLGKFGNRCYVLRTNLWKGRRQGSCGIRNSASDQGQPSLAPRTMMRKLIHYLLRPFLECPVMIDNCRTFVFSRSEQVEVDNLLVNRTKAWRCKP